jgi:hypothetical protein
MSVCQRSHCVYSGTCLPQPGLRLVFQLSLNLKFFQPEDWECVLFLAKNISTI